MQGLTNIIIPAIEINDELLNCLKGINKINSRNFFVSIILDKKNKINLPKYKYKINKLISGKINMSKKRNIAAKKFKSEYIAFLDADDWWDNKKLEKQMSKFTRDDVGLVFSNLIVL